MRDLTYEETESVSGGATNYNSSKSNVFRLSGRITNKAGKGGTAIVTETNINTVMQIDIVTIVDIQLGAA